MADYDIGEAFKAIEDELIASMMRNLDRHRAEETDRGYNWSMWQTEQLKALEKYRKRNLKKFGQKFQNINSTIESLIRIARSEGNLNQEIKILESIKKGFPAKKISKGLAAEFFKTNDRKLDALIKATTSDMKRAETAILRHANDQYRKIIYNAQVYANTGAGTYERAVDMATKSFLSAGIQCVEYKNGSRHTLSDYADMAIRTAAKRAYLYGEGEKRKEWGISTVIMNKRGNPCPKCAPFVGKIMIDDVWSGGKSTDGPYMLMSTAISKGLYHPRCKDSHTTYFLGISSEGAPYTEEEKKQVADRYNAEQKENNAKNQAEKHERMAKYSLDENNKMVYASREKQWNKQKENPNIDIANDNSFDIIVSGGRITNIFSKEAEKFAEMYYEEIRHFSTDTSKIAKNLGKNEDDIKKIKAYLFEDKSFYNPDTDSWTRFDPDCAIAQSWQRLMDGRNIKPHDRTLIEHELLEMRIKKENPDIEHIIAHKLASKEYDYNTEVLEYYGNLEKHRKDKK